MATDITRPNSLIGLGSDDLGTGIYWFLDPRHNYEQVFVPQITLAQSHVLADDFGYSKRQKLDAYRWVPEAANDAASLMAQKCGGKCTRDLECVDSACRCIRGECRRK